MLSARLIRSSLTHPRCSCLGVLSNAATLHLLRCSQRRVSIPAASWSSLEGVRAVKNRPLPQSVPSKSIHIPYSDQFVKAPLCSGVPDLHPQISPFSLVILKQQTVQHLIRVRRPHPDTNSANCLCLGLRQSSRCLTPLMGTLLNHIQKCPKYHMVGLFYERSTCIVHWLKFTSMFKHFIWTKCFDYTGVFLRARESSQHPNLWLKREIRDGMVCFLTRLEFQLTEKVAKIKETCLRKNFFYLWMFIL